MHWIKWPITSFKMWRLQKSAKKKIVKGERLTSDEWNACAYPHLRNIMNDIAKEYK